MTRLADLLSGVCEVLNALAVRAEDVIGEWVDNLGPRPPTSGQDELHRARELLSRWNDDAVVAWDGPGRRWVIGIPADKLEALVRDTDDFCGGGGRR